MGTDWDIPGGTNWDTKETEQHVCVCVTRFWNKPRWDEILTDYKGNQTDMRIKILLSEHEIEVISEFMYADMTTIQNGVLQ